MYGRLAIAVALAATATACASNEHRAAQPPPAQTRTPELQCRPSDYGSTTFADYPSGAAGRPGPPDEVVRERFRDVFATRDRVTLAQEQPDRAVVTVMRGPRTVAIVHLARAREAGWLVDQIDACGEFKTY